MLLATEQEALELVYVQTHSHVEVSTSAKNISELATLNDSDAIICTTDQIQIWDVAVKQANYTMKFTGTILKLQTFNREIQHHVRKFALGITATDLVYVSISDKCVLC